MSRIGKKVIAIPPKTEATFTGDVFKVKGPKGELERKISGDVVVKITPEGVSVEPKKTDINNIETLRGSVVSHLDNMIKGVNETFTKKLIVEGIGYKADVKGTELVLSIGFSHPVNMPIPKELKVASDKGVITISGLNKEAVGQFAAKIRAMKKPEPYKGKGIRYETEVVRRKQGKKTV